MMALAFGSVCGCSEEPVKTKLSAHIASERSEFLKTYPGSMAFDRFLDAYVGEFSIDLQRAIKKSPDQVYWLEIDKFTPDIVERSKGMELDFSAKESDDIQMFSLECPEKLVSALRETCFKIDTPKSDVRRMLKAKWFLAFTITGVKTLHLELRSTDPEEQDGDELPALADDLNTHLFIGTLLGVHRVSDAKQE